jgi:toxin ParE1/3/4
MAYRLSPLAEQDLEEIWLYVAEDASQTTADRLIDAIVDRFNLLAEQPAVGRARPEFGAGVRSFVVERYVIYYRVDDEVLIARVLHGHRDQAAAWTNWGVHRDSRCGHTDTQPGSPRTCSAYAGIPYYVRAGVHRAGARLG